MNFLKLSSSIAHFFQYIWYFKYPFSIFSYAAVTLALTEHSLIVLPANFRFIAGPTESNG